MFLFLKERETALPPYGGKDTELSGPDGTQLVIVLQIGFLLLPLEVLLALKFFPLGTILMTAGRVSGTILLTWKHRETPR